MAFADRFQFLRAPGKSEEKGQWKRDVLRCAVWYSSLQGTQGKKYGGLWDRKSAAWLAILQRPGGGQREHWDPRWWWSGLQMWHPLGSQSSGCLRKSLLHRPAVHCWQTQVERHRSDTGVQGPRRAENQVTPEEKIRGEGAKRGHAVREFHGRARNKQAIKEPSFSASFHDFESVLWKIHRNPRIA